jgi:hypothetical protein
MDALRLAEISGKLNRIQINLTNGINLRDSMKMDAAQ